LTPEIKEELKRIKKKHYGEESGYAGDFTTAEEFLHEVSWLFGWTTQQAYQATEFLFRPENNN
jgi:hypothetical protein